MTITSVPSSVFHFFSQRKGLTTAVLVFALSIIAARRSKRTPAFYLYSLRCGLNTNAKLMYSSVFTNAVQPPQRWGSEFTSSVLTKCLRKYNHQVDIIAQPEDCKFDKPTAIPALVDGLKGYHMTIFYVYKDGGDLHLEFFDGKALPITDPLNSRAKFVFDQFRDVKSFKQLSKPLQFDAHNCGPFAVWFIDQRQSGRTFEEIAEMNPDIEQYRQQILEEKAQ